MKPITAYVWEHTASLGEPLTPLVLRFEKHSVKELLVAFTRYYKARFRVVYSPMKGAPVWLGRTAAGQRICIRLTGPGVKHCYGHKTVK